MQFRNRRRAGRLALAAAFARRRPAPRRQTQAAGRRRGKPAPAPPAATRPSPTAKCCKVDKAAGKITLRHGPIPSLDMPEMTMVFRVKDPAMLDQVKAGRPCAVRRRKIGGQYTVVSIEPAIVSGPSPGGARTGADARGSPASAWPIRRRRDPRALTSLIGGDGCG